MTPEKEYELYLELFNEDLDRARIFNFLRFLRRGKERAITHDDLLEKLKKLNLEKMPDRRTLRKFLAERIPVGYINAKDKKGIFWPDSAEDLFYTHKDFRKKIISMNSRWAFLKKEHRELLNGDAQASLFDLEASL